MLSMKIDQKKTESVYIKVLHYRRGKLKSHKSIIIKESTPAEVVTMIESAVDRLANGKR